MPIKVTITVSRPAAILAGLSEYGDVDVNVDPALLTPEERRELADADRQNLSTYSINLSRSNATWLNGNNYPDIAKADLDAIRTILAHKASARAAKAQEEADKKTRKAAEWEARQDEWMAKPDTDLLTKIDTRDIGRGPDGFVKRPYAEYGQEYRPDVADRIERLTKEARRRLEIVTAEREKERAETARLETEKAARRAAQIEEYLLEYCTDEQRRRYAAELLPMDELLDSVRKSLFAPLDHIERYKKITPTEVREAEDANDHTKVLFKVEEAETATADEFATFEAIQKLVADKVKRPAKVELMIHYGGCDGPQDYSVERKSVKVTVTDREFEFSREYACP